MIFPTLYKKTVNGGTQSWSIEVRDDINKNPTIVVTHGKLDGIMQTATTVIRKGKNIGRANETTPRQQAELEAQSKFRKQKDKGYCETPDKEVLNQVMLKRPMLAHDYAKHKHKVVFPLVVQPKLDGMRCLAHKDHGSIRLSSRGNKPINTVPHINRALRDIMKDGEVWDGELYTHGEAFQTTMSRIKKASGQTVRVNYHVYDVISQEKFETRMTPIVQVIENSGSDFIIPVKWTGVTSHDEVKQFHDKCISEGYEGAIIRQKGCVYREGARSSDLLKVKEFLEEEFKVVGVVEGKGKFEEMAIFKLVTDQGVEFDCMPVGSDTQRRKYWEERDSAIGKYMTVRFFEWTTSEPPCPRFPVGKAFRKDGE